MYQINIKFIVLSLLAASMIGAEIKAKKGIYTYKGERKVFHQNIIEAVKKNDNFRKEMITGKNSQLVIMSIPVGGEIGEEIHPIIDQTFFFVEGKGIAIIAGKTTEIAPEHLIFVPAGTKHNFKNTGSSPLKLFTIYAPPQHKPGTVQKTKPLED